MIRCSKCDTFKPDDQYQTYYHSTHKKFRTRKVCTVCYYEQKKQYRIRKKTEKTIKLGYLYCQDCQQYLPPESFYKALKCRCKECQKYKESIERAEYRAENGGSAKVRMYPNEYVDEYQKAQTFEVMNVLGYTYNEENGVWFKLPWKTPDGKFPLIKPYVKKYKVTNIITKCNKDQYHSKVMYMHSNGMGYKEIADKLGINALTVYKWLKLKDQTTT